MWNGTHTKACNLNGYESVMCLTVFDSSGLYIGFPVLWVLCYNYLVARIGFIRISCFMILMPCLFLPAPSYLPPEYFLLDICIIVFTLLHHLVLLLHSPGEYHLTPLDSHVQVLELGACVQSSAAVAWISSLPTWATSFQAPCESLEFSFLNSWVSFSIHTCTFPCIHVCEPLLYWSYILCISCIPAFAHICDVILL